MTLDEMNHRIKFLENNFKQYQGGVTYNGVALNVTGTNNFTLDFALFVPYQTIETSDGSDSRWRMIFNLRGTINASTANSITIAGVTFTSKGYQACTNSTGTNVVKVSEHVVPSTGILQIEYSANATVIISSGNVELESKPTWADTIT